MSASVAKLATAPAVDIRAAMTDPHLFGRIFGGPTWAAWRALLAGFYGLPLDDTEAELWRSLTGRRRLPDAALIELWLAVGRRGGKSYIAALLAVFEAVFRDQTARLSPGEIATVMVIAADRKQSRTVMRYIAGLIESNAMLAGMVVRSDRESIELCNRTVIEVQTASFRAVRGYTISCCIADEIAFWRSEESANPDTEIIAALRPAMATLGGKLIALSSPYAKKGALWQTYRDCYGKDDPEILVAQAASRTMNPSLPEKVVTRALERDEESAKAEYLAQFRNDLASFVRREVVEACVVPGRFELPYCSNFTYYGFCDPSGGSNDAMTLAIGHREENTIVIDLTREVRPPFSPEAVAKDFADVLLEYRIKKVEGDRYGGEWPRERFSVHKVEYVPSARPRTELYKDTLPLFNGGLIELPDNKRLVTQFANLERRTARSGKDLIDHPVGSHDDLCNAVAGLAAGLSTRKTSSFNYDNV